MLIGWDLNALNFPSVFKACFFSLDLVLLASRKNDEFSVVQIQFSASISSFAHSAGSQVRGFIHLSHEKNPGWLGYIRDEKLPSYIGIIISHY